MNNNSPIGCSFNPLSPKIILSNSFSSIVSVFDSRSILFNMVNNIFIIQVDFLDIQLSNTSLNAAKITYKLFITHKILISFRLCYISAIILPLYYPILINKFLVYFIPIFTPNCFCESLSCFISVINT
jgi:hypothetical protein